MDCKEELSVLPVTFIDIYTRWLSLYSSSREITTYTDIQNLIALFQYGLIE